MTKGPPCSAAFSKTAVAFCQCVVLCSSGGSARMNSRQSPNVFNLRPPEMEMGGKSMKVADQFDFAVRTTSFA